MTHPGLWGHPLPPPSGAPVPQRSQIAAGDLGAMLTRLTALFVFLVGGDQYSTDVAKLVGLKGEG